MKLDSNIYEITEESREGAAYWDLIEAKRKLEFYVVQYEVELQAIERRKKLLLWGIEVQAALVIFFILLILFFGLNALFGGVAMVISALAVMYLIYSTIRLTVSYFRHVGKLSVDNIYTLAEEQQDVGKEIARVHEAIHKIDLQIRKKQVWNPNEDPDITQLRTQEEDYEQQSRELLSYLAPELTFKEHRADYLYGERIK